MELGHTVKHAHMHVHEASDGAERELGAEVSQEEDDEIGVCRL